MTTMKKRCLLIAAITGLLSCKDSKDTTDRIPAADTRHTVKEDAVSVPEVATADTIVLSRKHHPNTIICDLDGDDVTDSVHIVQHLNNGKYGLKIIFGNKRTEYMGMGVDVLGQGFDDINWAGVFEKAPKGEVYWNNVNDEGEIISEEQVKAADKITLINDGIFIHEAEAC